MNKTEKIIQTPWGEVTAEFVNTNEIQFDANTDGKHVTINDLRVNFRLYYVKRDGKWTEYFPAKDRWMNRYMDFSNKKPVPPTYVKKIMAFFDPLPAELEKDPDNQMAMINSELNYWERYQTGRAVERDLLKEQIKTKQEEIDSATTKISALLDKKDDLKRSQKS